MIFRSRFLLPIVIISFFVQVLLATDCVLPLFISYPSLSAVPHIDLGRFPTPLKALNNLSRMVGTEIWCKDDSKSGDLFGGNKVRKLEFLLADALANKAQAVITVGGAGSNHAVATAAYAHQVGLTAYILLTPQMITRYTRRNLLLDVHFKASIEYFSNRDLRNSRIISLLNSKQNYFIPVGGSNELGALGFVNAAFELKQQCDEQNMPYPDYIYVPYGSYGTISGLLVGLKAAGMNCKLVGVCTDEDVDPSTSLKAIIDRARLINNYVRAFDDQFPELPLTEDDISIRLPGSQYAEVTKETRDAIALMKNEENIQLDTTYSGKAMAALLKDIADNADNIRGKRILFWKTYADGEQESLINDVDYKQLPADLQYYFDESLQLWDDQGC